MRRHPSRFTARPVMLAGLVASLVACGAPSDPVPDAPSEPARPAPVAAGGPGQVLYLTYCQSCHGVTGRGDGGAAAALRTPPADLTRLWERYGTPLDHDRVAEYIDGRAILDLHGPREMPVWGDEFFGGMPPMAPNLEGAKRHLIEVLVEYLETLQGERQT